MSKRQPDARHNRSLTDYVPFTICAFLIYVPFFFHKRSESFAIDLVLDPLEHALAGGTTIFLILASAAIGIHLGRRRDRRTAVHLSPRGRLCLWLLTFSAIFLFIGHLAFALASFIQGNFLAAREAVDVPGIGIVIRLPLVTLPVLTASSPSERRSTLFTLLLLIALDCVRSLIMSERTALIEAACLAIIYARITRIKIRPSVIFGAITALAVLFAVILQVRLLVQSELGATIDPSETTLTQSLAAYYADTTNKYYQALNGTLEYPVVNALAPFQSLNGGRRPIVDQYNEYLSLLEGFSPFIISGLNNSGGLAEDISDFGLLGFVAIGLRFVIFGFLIARIEKSSIATAMSVLVLIAVLEYPRFNYFNMPFAAYLAALAILIGIFTRRNSRSTSPPSPFNKHIGARFMENETVASSS